MARMLLVLLLVLATAAMVAAAPAMALPMLPGSSRIDTTKTCLSWFNTCMSLCRTRLKGNPTCFNFCGSSLVTCRQTGCWEETDVRHLHCGLRR